MTRDGRRPTLWAISDLHTGHTGNKPVTESLYPSSSDDWLIVAGDVPEIVVSAVAAGPNESAMTDRVAPIANNNANASHMTVCFIAASPEANRTKNPPYPPSPGRRWQLQNQFGPVRGRLMALAGRPRGKRPAVEAKRRMG